MVPPATDRAAPPPENLGVAISSPLLELAEGERAITLTLGVAATGWSEAAIQAALARDPFTVRLTTAKGWIAPTKVVIVTGDYAQLSGVTRPLQAPLAALQLQLSVDVDVDPIAPLADSQLPTGDPALRVTLRQLWDEDAQQYVCAYGPLRDLELQAAHLAVDVVGLTELTLESDAGPLDPRRAFEPFGDAPSVGERLYLGHRELAVKRLDRLTLRFAWMGAPKQLAAHYANYGLGSIDNHSFTARVALIDRRRESTLVAAAPLFALEDARAPHAITIAALPEAAGHTRDASFTGALARWSRCFTCELTPRSLQHEEYPSVAAARAVALSAAIAGGQPINAAEYQVARPYTPKLRRLAVDYASSEELVLGTAAAERALSRLFHVRPFGAHQITPAADGAAHRLLPAFVDAGELYIGIAELAPPQQLTLLLQLADGSADPSLAPERVTWSYLSGDQWRSLHDGRLLADTTAGLSHSGILRFDLPAALPSTQLPAGRYWLRATIPSAPRSVCTTVAVRAQAVTATFVDEDVAPDHHAHPLPAGAITGLQTQDPAIAGVEQPYTSYGGKPRERAETFRVRVSERLRHKQRALTVWDYERLILERFPELYKVKCLPADLVDHTDAPGQVDIVVIPDIRNKLPFDPFEPKAPANLLADVEAFIGARCPTFARVRVRNASYVSVKARLGVRFRPGHDEGFYRALLNDELSRFLSPWAYDDAAEIVIGDRIYANSVINFVDRRPYVDYVADIKLFTSDDGRDYVYAQPSAQRDVEGYYVTPRRPDGVLVAARQHQIDVITELQYSAELFSGINHMKVELDFVVG
ncbi:MAG: baseplate J/gp47 family protein [Nannocystaceae bacterium]